MIEEETDHYLNNRLTTLLMARDYLKEYFSKLERPQNPFINNPFAMVWTAFKNLYGTWQAALSVFVLGQRNE